MSLSTVQGVQAVADFIETELSPEEVLDAMGSVILLRNRHSHLDQNGIFQEEK